MMLGCIYDAAYVATGCVLSKVPSIKAKRRFYVLSNDLTYNRASRANQRTRCVY